MEVGVAQIVVLSIVVVVGVVVLRFLIRKPETPSKDLSVTNTHEEIVRSEKQQTATMPEMAQTKAEMLKEPEKLAAEENALSPEEKLARFKAEAAKRAARESMGHTMGMVLAGFLFGLVALVISTCSGGK
jgi:cell division septation protein DedD